MVRYEEALAKPLPSPAHIVEPLNLSRRKTPSPTPNRLTTVSTSATVTRSSHLVPQETQDVFSPTSPALGRIRSVRSNGSAGRPSGPRSARPITARAGPAVGSSYTTLSVTSGNDRLISPSGESRPLQEISNETSRLSPSNSQKRARPQEELVPRKRSADYTTAVPTSDAGTSRATSASGLQAEERRRRNVAESSRQVSSASAASRDTIVVSHRDTRADHRKSLANYYAPEHAAENTDEHVRTWTLG